MVGLVRVWHPRIAVAFAPTAPGVFETTLEIPIPYYNTSVTATLRGSCTVSDAPSHPAQPTDFALAAFPNPFNAQTRIAFTLPVAGDVSLRVFDLLGRERTVLTAGPLSAGAHEYLWDAAALPAGLYFVRLTTPNGERTAKLLLVK